MSPIQRMTQLIQRGHAEASATLNTAASRRQRGASATEYAIIVAVVAVALTAAFAGDTGIQQAFTTFITNIGTAISTGSWPTGTP